MSRESNAIREDGLRYRNKVAGSVFGAGPVAMLSCFLCGQHRPRSILRSMKVANATHYRCGEGCGKLSVK